MHDVRPHHRDTIADALRVLRAFLAGEHSTDQFLDQFSPFGRDALDGHEDDEGPIPMEQLMATPSLRLLYEADRLAGLIFDEKPENDTKAYLAARRIKSSELRDRIHEALARAAVELALTTMEST
jgi:hypothetical protein